jgi:hypothetical protein
VRKLGAFVAQTFLKCVFCVDMLCVELFRSYKPGKKYAVRIGGRVVHFGAKGYSDFTKHHDEERKIRYLRRHKPTENWRNPKSAGFWSRWLLWNKPTIKQSITDIQRRFNIKIL